MGPTEEGMYPLIEVANSRAGEPGQPITTTVYRTWTPEDVQKACAAITSPEVDIEACIEDIHRLNQIYHPNGIVIRGDWNPQDQAGTILAHDSQQLRDPLNAVLARMRNHYIRRADYAAISRCIQKDEEPYGDYAVRMKDVFARISGIPPTEDEAGHYKQQLKMALHNGSKSPIKDYIDRHMVDFPTAT